MSANHPIDYAQFLQRKSQTGTASGFKPLWLPSFLFDFQAYLTEWDIRMGRAANFVRCGLGKTPIAFVWAQNVVQHTNRPVLYATTLGDCDQAVKEAAKFQVEAARSKDGKIPSGKNIVVTNFERLHLFNPSDFVGGVANESSILKNFKGKRKVEITEFFRTLPYRLLCTATPSPNDYIELGTSSEALGDLGYQDMLARFFVKSLAARGTIGWGREQYRMKGHAERAFWQWVCSWARSCRRPSDLGPFDDERFRLPELIHREHIVQAKAKRDGFLFDLPAQNMQEEREELRRTLQERCETAAKLVQEHDGHSIAWCYLNEEGNLLEKIIPGSRQISGSDPDDLKEEIIEWFIGSRCLCHLKKRKRLESIDLSAGEKIRETSEGIDFTSITVTTPAASVDSSAQDATRDSDSSGTSPNVSIVPQCTCGHRSGKRVLITKPKILSFGLNFQHCAHMTFFPSHSWEQWHQAIHRCWRFGQTRPVVNDVIATEGMRGALANLQNKEEKVDRMFSRLVEMMGKAQGIGRTAYGTKKEELPGWLSSHRN